MRRLRRFVAALALSASLGACEHFLPPEVPAQATGPIAPGYARIRIQNTGSLVIRETWYSPCLGGESVLKVRRRIDPGESTQQDLPAGCVRLTVYPDAGAFYFTIQAPAGEVTVVDV